MYLSTILAATPLFLSVLAAPTAGTLTSKPRGLAARACAPLSSPTAPYTLVASAPNTAIHYMTVNLGPNHQVILDGEPDVPPCPLADGGCAPGAYSVWSGFGSLYVQVPGGQQTYVGPAGALGFTAAHSAATPRGAILDPFTYYKSDQCHSPNGVISTHAFGAKGLMACPRRNGNGWRVWANFAGARVPTENINDCIPFQALAYDYDDAGNGNYHAAAFQYD